MRIVGAGGRRAVVLAALCSVLAFAVGAAAWALAAPAGARGHDISYPQCGAALPTTGTFGIVGVNGGKVSTANPCLAGQYTWASGRSGDPGLYVNTGNPGSMSTFYWPANGASDPALCTTRTDPADPGCAYDYGWHGAENSLQIATRALGGGVTARAWWLDVELANSWNGSTTANAASLQGAIDRLRSAGIGNVGIYSTTYQWGVITGGYKAANAATYRAAWARAFSPKFPMESAPLWVAGLGSLDDAAAHCSASFTGAKVTLAQYSDGAVDGDLVCGGGTSPTTTTPTAPTSTRPTTTTTTPRTTAPTTPAPTTPAPTTPAPTTLAPTTLAPTTAPVVPVPTTTVPATSPLPSTSATTPTPASTPAPTTTRPTTTVVPPTTTTAPPPTAPGLTPVATTTPAPAGAVGPPTSVRASAYRPGGVLLTWARPTTGGPVTRYVVLRGAAAGRGTVLGVLTCTTPVCAWQDTTVHGTVAYYQVAAMTPAGGVGPRSAEVSARGR